MVLRPLKKPGQWSCGSCGYRMRGKYEGQKASILYYKCPNAMNRLSGMEQVCHEKSVNGKRLEGIVWDVVMHLFSDQGQFERALHRAHQAKLVTFSLKQERLDTILGMIHECEKEARK